MDIGLTISRYYLESYSFSQTTASALEAAIHLGIAYTVTAASRMDQREVLVQDFEVVETVFFPRFVLQLSFPFLGKVKSFK